ncbi:60S ribosomal protein L27a-2 [Glycine max]|nr:60S ribosomal protein L27a-2 [Glycine max]
MHHRWILFGKDRMGYFHKLHNKFYSSILNIDKLWSLLPQEVKASKENKASFTQFGYFKVLKKESILIRLHMIHEEIWDA